MKNQTDYFTTNTNKRSIHNSRGITLIALVITIIVILILAGVALSMTTGETGILTQSQTAKIQHEFKTVLEEVEAQCEYTLEGKVNLTKTLSNINQLNLNQIKSAEINESGDTLIVTFENSETLEIKGMEDGTSINRFGFYFNKRYVCTDYWGDHVEGIYCMTFFENGKVLMELLS